MTKLIVAFCNFANAPKNSLVESAVLQPKRNFLQTNVKAAVPTETSETHYCFITIKFGGKVIANCQFIKFFLLHVSLN
jgi:hypothetical protein